MYETSRPRRKYCISVGLDRECYKLSQFSKLSRWRISIRSIATSLVLAIDLAKLSLPFTFHLPYQIIAITANKDERKWVGMRWTSAGHSNEEWLYVRTLGQDSMRHRYLTSITGDQSGFNGWNNCNLRHNYSCRTSDLPCFSTLVYSFTDNTFTVLTSTALPKTKLLFYATMMDPSVFSQEVIPQ